MKLAVNGQMREVQALNLAAALEELGFGGAKVATAVNAVFVPRGAREGLELQEGDQVEIVAPQQGG